MMPTGVIFMESGVGWREEGTMLVLSVYVFSGLELRSYETAARRLRYELAEDGIKKPELDAQ
jgi:hypothetical protein